MHKWLLFLETMVLALFFALMFLHVKVAGTEENPQPLAQAQSLMERGDSDFAKQDLVKALVAYWSAINSIETAKEGRLDTGNQLEKSLLNAHLRVAEIYFHSNWNEDAEAHLERVAKEQPDHIGVHLLRGKLLYGYGEKAAATEALLHVLEKDSTNPEAHYTLGLLYQGAQQYKEAIHYYKQAIENDAELVPLPFESAPFGLLARLQLSRTYRRIVHDYTYGGRDLSAEELSEIVELTDKAVELLKEAVAQEPNFADAKDDLIDLLYVQAQSLERGEGDVRFYGDALEVDEYIVELDANQVDAWQKMGAINLSFLQEPESALEAYQKAYQLYPDPLILAAIKSIQEGLQIQIPE